MAHSLEAIEVEVRRFRRPWYWPALLLLAAAAATWLLAANGRSRMAANERAFRASQQIRLGNVSIEIDDYFGRADQLAAAGAQAFAPIHGDVAAARRLTAELFASRQSDKIVGLGPFFVPYTFDPSVRFFSVYDELYDGRVREELHLPTDSDYTHYAWYRRSVEKPGDLVWDGPYEEGGRSYISTLKAFSRDGKVVGVMAVDTLTIWFKQMIAGPLSSGDIAWIESSVRGVYLLGTQAPPQNRSGYIDIQTPLRYTGARVHLLSDAAPLYAANRTIAQGTIGSIAAVWIIAIGALLALLQSWRTRERTLKLELQEAHLRHEIETNKTVEAELRKAAYTDALTGLPSRTPFMERVSQAIEEYRSGKQYAVFFIDLDRFNKVNDILGHAAGDEMLKTIATRLLRVLPAEAMLARVGGDEFIVIAPAGRPASSLLAEAMLAVLREPVDVAGRSFYSAASIGIVSIGPEHVHPDDLLRDADIAMYQAKRAGRDRYATFDAAMRAAVSQETDLEDAIRHAIERFEFLPFYQPIVNIGNGTIVSFEALARWNRPQQGLLEAGRFIGFAETHGLIDPIDAQLFEKVCEDVARLGEHVPNAPIAVNLSASHLAQPDLAKTITASLVAHNVAPSRVKLEITETAVMSNAVHARTTLETLRDAGLEIVLDDFGQGHSSLAYLKHLPIAGLKIDRMFVEPLGREPQAIAIVRSIVALAQTLGLYTVAEGIETQEQRDALAELGIYGQGYYYARPCDLETLLRQRVNA